MHECSGWGSKILLEVRKKLLQPGLWISFKKRNFPRYKHTPNGIFPSHTPWINATNSERSAHSGPNRRLAHHELPAFYGFLIFIIALTRFRHGIV
jgi:Na+-transporting NADH:ubiquinone oxidoreductase subunit NqrA